MKVLEAEGLLVLPERAAVPPASQLKACRKKMAKELGLKPTQVTCQWRFVREGVPGWLKARRIEAGYATRDKNVEGKCPPGMVKCL